MEKPKNSEQSYSSQSIAEQEGVETKDSDETRALLDLERIENNSAEIENLITQLPQGESKEQLSKFEELKQIGYDLLLKIESASSHFTQRPFLPETLKKLALVKEMNRDFQPQVSRGGLMSAPINDIRTIQEFDMSLLEKLNSIKDLAFVSGGTLFHDRRILSEMPSFVENLKHIDTDELRHHMMDYENSSIEESDSWKHKSIEKSSFVPFVTNYNKVEDKQKLAEFCDTYHNYLSSRTRDDRFKDDIPVAGGWQSEDVTRIPEFFLINSALDINDDNLTELLDGPNLQKNKKEFILKHHPWLESMNDLLKIQSQSKRIEFNLWINELRPLVKQATSEKIISFDSREDAEILVDYVKKFGMRNTPELFKTFVSIKKAGSVQEIDPQIKNQLKEELNIDADKLCEKDPSNLGLIINEISKYKKELLINLRDEDTDLVNKLEKSELALDLFESVKGSSPFWKEKAVPKEVIETYKTAMVKHPERFELKGGYEKSTLDIPEVKYTESTNETIEQAKAKILNNPDFESELNRLRDAGKLVRTYGTNISLMREKLNEPGLLRQLEESVETAKLDYQNLLLTETQNEKALFGVKNKFEGLEASLAQFKKLTQNNNLDTLQTLELYQEIIPDKLPGKRNAIINLSLAYINEVMPGSTYSFLDSASSQDDEGFAKEGANFLSQYVREHILNKNHDQQIAGLLKPDVIRGMKRAFGLTDKNIVIETAKKLETFNKGQLTGKTRSVSFIPSKGLQRVFSGNIAGSCIDQQEKDFANGKFENITSFTLVLDEDKPTERLAGAFLVIETQTDNKEPILVIRSNNPAENLFSMLDGDSLVSGITEVVKNVAAKRGINLVGVPCDVSGKASSNREMVSQYYQDNFKENEKTGLIKNKDTNFNDYPIWDKEAQHAVAII